jgi:hypothetical protein
MLYNLVNKELSRAFLWIDSSLIYASLSLHIIVQIQKIQVEMGHLQRLLDFQGRAS